MPTLDIHMDEANENAGRERKKGHDAKMKKSNFILDGSARDWNLK